MSSDVGGSFVAATSSLLSDLEDWPEFGSMAPPSECLLMSSGGVARLPHPPYILVEVGGADSGSPLTDGTVSVLVLSVVLS